MEELREAVIELTEEVVVESFPAFEAGEDLMPREVFKVLSVGWLEFNQKQK